MLYFPGVVCRGEYHDRRTFEILVFLDPPQDVDAGHRADSDRATSTKNPAASSRICPIARRLASGVTVSCHEPTEIQTAARTGRLPRRTETPVRAIGSGVSELFLRSGMAAQSAGWPAKYCSSQWI